jgi:hypothetical protein
MAQSDDQMTYRRALVFKRWYPEGPVSKRAYPRDKQLVNTFPFDTDDDKVHFAEAMLQSPRDFDPFFDRDCLRRTRTTVHEKDEAGKPYWGGGDALQFYQVAHTSNLMDKVPHDAGDKCHGFDENDDDIVSVSLTFPVGTRAEKLAFAQWIETKRFGDFLQQNSHVHFTSLVSMTPESTPWVPQALRAVSDALYEHRERIPQDAYVAVSNAMKRTHDQL